ncbi:MAG: hypothetical protein IJ953_04360 [Campylobacter sp.]|nr:hypothetical protein [Campylobacter sp.]
MNRFELGESNAFYTACIGICSKYGEYGVHGFMHGKVIDKELGDNGFGYALERRSYYLALIHNCNLLLFSLGI